MAASCLALAALLLPTRSAHAEDARDEDRAPTNRFAMSLGAGFAGYKLYGVSIAGGALEAVVGGNVGHLTLAADVEGLSGSTQFGLSTHMFTLGMLFAGDFDRFRLGGGFRFGTLSVERSTTADSLQGSSIGIFMRATFDVVRFADDLDAVYLALKLNTDSVGGTLYGVTLGVGVRF
jgi:hypothetical protein